MSARGGETGRLDGGVQVLRRVVAALSLFALVACVGGSTSKPDTDPKRFASLIIARLQLEADEKALAAARLASDKIFEAADDNATEIREAQAAETAYRAVKAADVDAKVSREIPEIGAALEAVRSAVKKSLMWLDLFIDINSRDEPVSDADIQRVQSGNDEARDAVDTATTALSPARIAVEKLICEVERYLEERGASTLPPDAFCP